MEKAADLLLDTSAIIESFRGNPKAREQLIEAPILYLPAIVVGELHRGLYKSKRAEQGRAKIARLQSISTSVVVDWKTGELYAQIDAELAGKGTPIPDNDVWIAALAKQHGLRLFTKDKHFERIDGLDLLML